MKSRDGRSIRIEGGGGGRSRDAVRKFTANRGRKLKRNGTPLPDYLNMYKIGPIILKTLVRSKKLPLLFSLSFSPIASLPFGFDKIFSREGRGHARSRVRKRFSKWVVINRNGVKQSLSKGVVTTFSLADEIRLSVKGSKNEPISFSQLFEQ